MARSSLIWGLLLFGCCLQVSVEASDDDPLEFMSREEREALKEEARDMFYHAYNAYIDNAYPADELMPLSCKGRYRGSEPNRGDIDATLGNFSLTLVDTLDTLVVLGDLEEFEHAVKLVVKDVSFDTDVIVSLFETNIRMLGGLLSGHILAEYLQQRADIMPWYRGELLKLAKDLGYRFLPAFNTTTGIPYGRVNLKHGMKGVPIEMSKETCTACAGSMILEMAALSRLTGEPIFEEKAQKAMDVLWRMRHRGTDLMGSVLNVNSGDWVRRDSGVGAGIDSYYEYCLKAYILLGDEKYLSRFNRHYQAVMKYVSQGPMLLDVHMHRPNTNSKNFMDALLAFWPGLQVLKGDIKPAVETHEMLYQVMQRHNFIPEAFTTDFQVHWGHHPLRPEFLESTYFLYRATGDHYYLGVGRKVLTSLQTYAKVSCGYAAVSDVRTNKHDDTMDSFVLSETLKYLFLLFAEPNDLVLDLDEFIFTTEGHLLPLTLASMRTNASSDIEKDVVHVDEFDRACPNSLHLFPASVRQPLRNMVEDVCPRRTIKRRLSASQFQASNLEHLSILSDMGITILTLADGRVQLLHTFSNAKTPRDAEEGLSFMQEMVELSKVQTQQSKTRPQVVTFAKPNTYPVQEITLLACPAHFGPELRGSSKISGNVIFTNPPSACSELVNADKLAGKIVIVDRGNCIFVEKARRIQKAGAIAGIVLDNVAGSSVATSPMFAMSGDGKDVDDVTIPVVFLFSTEASYLLQAVVVSRGDLTVNIGDFVMRDKAQLKAPPDLSIFERLKDSLKELLTRQMTPQLSTSSSAGLDLKTSEIEQADDHEVIVEYAHLRAVIVPNVIGEDIRINVNLDVAAKVREQKENESRFEGKWQYLKWMFVNEIVANIKKHSALHIKSSALKDYYKLVQIERGIVNDAIRNINLSRQVLWFLKELSEVTPDLHLTKIMRPVDLEKEKLDLWKEYLWSKLNNVAFLKTVALLFKSHISMNSEWEGLFELLDSNKLQVENYPLLRKFVYEIFKDDGPQKFLRKMFNEDESIRRYMTLLDHIRTVEQSTDVTMLIDRLSEEPEDGSADLADFPRLKSDDITVMEFATDNNEDKKIDNTEKMYKTETKSAQSNSDIVNDVYLQYWTDIGMLDDAIEKDGSSEANVDVEVEENHESTKSNEFNEELKSQDERRDVDNRNEVEAIKKKLDFLMDIELKVVEFYETVDRLKLGRKNIDYEEISIDEDVAFVFPESTEVKSNSGSLETVSNDERRRLLQEIQKEISDSQSNRKDEVNVKNSKSKDVINSKTRSNDPLEEFKKPIWATDEGKVTEQFSEFQQKSDISRMAYDATERHRFEYGEDYTVKHESVDVEGKHKGRHIDDEL